MTQAIPRVPGAIYLATRKCTDDRFFLRPDGDVSAVFRYMLAVAAERSGVEVIAAVVMSNHYHIVMHDRLGQAPLFFNELNGLVARALNCRRERCGDFWDHRSVHLLPLLDADAVERKIVYTMCNPVRAGLVASGREWPGVRTNPQSWVRGVEVVSRPRFFFREDGLMPASVELVHHVPPTHRGVDAAAFSERVAARVRAEEERLRAEMAASGRRFLGVRGVKRQPWRSRPAGERPRGERVPVVSGARAACKEAIAWLRLFGRRYSEALSLWRTGDRDVVFPFGTWKMRVLHAARAQPPPAYVPLVIA